MNQEVVQSKSLDVTQAVKEVSSKLKKPGDQYNAVLFFASSAYNFEELSSQLHELFPKAQVVGASSSGEITRDGFAKNTLVLTALYDSRTKFSGVLLEDCRRFPIVQKNEIVSAASAAGINISSSSAGKDAFAISMICGILNIEEGVLSLLYSLIKDPDFMVAGGSSGDDLKFKTTYVSLNGRVSTSGAVILFVRTSCKFKIIKENIFTKSNKSVIVTKSDPDTHVVRSLDNQVPRRRYAQILGISENQAESAILDHPFGRVFGDNVFVASLVKFLPDGSLPMYARVLEGSMQEVLNPLDPIAKTEETCKNLLAEMPDPKCVILFNCILRTVGFEQKGIQARINDIWKKYLPIYAGFSTYGEQFCHINSNQTLVALVIGD